MGNSAAEESPMGEGKSWEDVMSYLKGFSASEESPLPSLPLAETGQALEGLTWALIFELQREQRARKEAEARCEEQRRLALVYKVQLQSRRTKTVRFAEGGLDDDDDDDDDGSDDGFSVVVGPLEEEPKLVPECVAMTLERHARGLQKKNDLLQSEIVELEARLDREVAARLQAEEKTNLLQNDDDPPTPSGKPKRRRKVSCAVCYQPLDDDGDDDVVRRVEREDQRRSSRRMKCCGAVACEECLLELADDGDLCCPECFVTLRVDDAFDDDAPPPTAHHTHPEHTAHTTDKHDAIPVVEFAYDDDDDDNGGATSRSDSPTLLTRLPFS